MVSLFPVASITKCHNHGTLKTQIYSPEVLEVKVQNHFTGLKSACLAGLVPSRGLRGSLFPGFSSSKATCIPCFLASCPSSKPAT